VNSSRGDLGEASVPVGGDAAAGGGFPREIEAIGDLAGKEGDSVVATEADDEDSCRDLHGC